MLAVRPHSSTGVWRVRIDETDLTVDSATIDEIHAGGVYEVRIDGPNPWLSPALLLVAEALKARPRGVALHSPDVALVSRERCVSLRKAGVGALELPLGAAAVRPRAFAAALVAARAAGVEPRVVLTASRAAGVDSERLGLLVQAVVRASGPELTLLVDGFEGKSSIAEDLAFALRVGRGPGVRVSLRDVADVVEPRLCLPVERDIALDSGRVAALSADDLVEQRVVDQVTRVAGSPQGMAHLLAARGRPVRDLPPCSGGRGETGPDVARAAACGACPLTSCRGLAERHHAAFPPGPRPFWSGFGNRVAVVVEEQFLFGAYGAQGIARGLRDAGVEVVLARAGEPLPPVDTVVTTPFDLVPSLLASDSKRRVVVLDHHMLAGIESLSRALLPPGKQAHEGGSWPSNLFVVSSFPSFAHLYTTAGIPLEQVAWFPYCVDREALPSAVDDPEGPIICAGGHLRDWRTLERAAERLDGTPIEVVHPHSQPVRPVGTLRPTGECRLSEFLPRLASARFAVVVCHADARVTTGGSTIVAAQAIGKAIVATWTPMARDFLRPGIDSLVVPAGDDRALADAIDRLDRDDALRARLAAGAAAAGRARDATVLGHFLARGFPPQAVWPVSDQSGTEQWQAWPHGGV